MTGARVLLDTGPLVAYLHRGEQDHSRCREFLESFRGAFFTTEAVLTEAAHLLDRIPNGPRACLDFFLHGGAELIPLTHQRLDRCFQLMDRYSDIPMDYADATLVVLAEETGIREIFTLDRRGFSAYRTMDGRALRIRP